MPSPSLRPHHHPRKEKRLVILGATGAGKSRLSIDLTTRFPSYIINSDKGLDIVANKITSPDRRGVPHHLLGSFHDDHVDFTPSMFHTVGSLVVSAVHSRRGIPILVEGSNSFVHALVSEGEMSNAEGVENLFSAGGTCLSWEPRYGRCLLWVDVSMPVEYQDRRVEELRRYLETGRRKYGRGLRRAMGVEEFERYLETGRRRDFEEAVREVKENTRRLAKRQVGVVEDVRVEGCLAKGRLSSFFFVFLFFFFSSFFFVFLFFFFSSCSCSCSSSSSSFFFVFFSSFFFFVFCSSSSSFFLRLLLLLLLLLLFWFSRTTCTGGLF